MRHRFFDNVQMVQKKQQVSSSSSASSPLASWNVRYDQIKPHTTKLSSVPDALIGYMDPQSMAKYEHEVSKKSGAVATSSIQQAKAWELAMSPAKTLPMNMMMMWMSGNGVQLFSMMVVMMMITNPLKGITSINNGMYKSILTIQCLLHTVRHSTRCCRRWLCLFCATCLPLRSACTSAGAWVSCLQKAAIGLHGMSYHRHRKCRRCLYEL